PWRLQQRFSSDQAMIWHTGAPWKANSRRERSVSVNPMPPNQRIKPASSENAPIRSPQRRATPAKEMFLPTRLRLECPARPERDETNIPDIFRQPLRVALDHSNSACPDPINSRTQPVCGKSSLSRPRIDLRLRHRGRASTC